MPLTEDQKQALIKKAFTNAGVTYPEDKITERKNDPEMIRLHEEARTVYAKVEENTRRLKTAYPTSERGISRVFFYFMNHEDTPQAKQENDRLYESLKTPGGIQVMANRFIKECMETDLAGLTPTDPADMAKKYIEDPYKYERLFAVCYIADNLEGSGYEIEEPLRTAFHEKTRAVQTAGLFKNACRTMASDEWAVLSQDFTAGELDRLTNEMVTGATFNDGTPDEKLYAAPLGSFLSQLGDSVKNVKAARVMSEKKWFRDGISFKLEDEELTRGKLLDRIAQGQVTDLDAVEVVEEETEKKQQVENQWKGLSLDLLDVTIEKGRKAKKEASLPVYQKMLDYHRPSFTDAGISLPSAKDLQARMEDPHASSIHEKAKTVYVENEKRREELFQTFYHDSNMSSYFKRVYRYLLDPADTIQALEHNRMLQAASGTVEGQQRMINATIKMLMDKPDDFFFPKTIQEAAERFTENPSLYWMAWAVGDLVNGIEGDDRFKIDPELKKAFTDRMEVFQNGGHFISAAKYMSRDDWGIFDTAEIDPEQLGLLMASRSEQGISRNDPYFTLTLPDNMPDTLLDIYGFRYSESGMPGIRERVLPLIEQGSNLFKMGAKVTVNGAETNTERALTYIVEHNNSQEGVTVTYDPELAKRVREKAKALNTDLATVELPETEPRLSESTRPGMALVGKALSRDMTGLYEKLDSANHGLFRSSPEYTRVIKAVKAMSQENYSHDQAEKAFDEVLEAGRQYIANKNGKTSFSARERNRLKYIKEAVAAMEERKKALKEQHEMAETAHKGFMKEFDGPERSVKSNAEIRRAEEDRNTEGDPEKILDLESDRLAKKFNAEGIKVDEDVEVVYCLSREQIRARMADPHRADLHKRAKALQEKLDQMSGTVNVKYDMGKGNADLSRFTYYFMDQSGTPEAEEHNRLIAAAITTPEGCKALMSRMTYEILTNPVAQEAMTATTPEEKLAAFEKDPRICDMTYNIGNIPSFTNYLDEPLRTAFKDHISAWEGASQCRDMVTYLASDLYFAYDDIKLGDDNAYMKANNLMETLRVIRPELEDVSKAMVSLSIPTKSIAVMKEMRQKGILKLENEYTDLDGKHLKLEEAAAKIGSDGIQSVKCSTRDKYEELPKEIEALYVAEPLKIGREVLKGTLPGVTGELLGEHFNERIDELREAVASNVVEYPGQYHEALDRTLDLLNRNRLKKNETLDYAEAEKRFGNISKSLQECYDSMPPKIPGKNYNAFEGQIKAGINNALNLVSRMEKKAHMIQEHQAYETEKGLFEHANGADRYVKEHVTGENALPLPDKMKDTLKEFVRISETHYSGGLKDMTEQERTGFMKGMADILIVNRMEQEKKQFTNEAQGPVTKIVSQGSDSAGVFCDAMVRVKGFDQICENLLRNPAEMKDLLQNSGKMDDVIVRDVLGEVNKGKTKEHSEKLIKTEPVKTVSESSLNM